MKKITFFSHLWIAIAFVSFFSFIPVNATEPLRYEVIPQKSFLYSSPQEGSPSKTYLKHGQVIRITEPPVNGFYPIRTKNNDVLYVKKSQLRALDTAEETFQADASESTSPHYHPTLTYDLGVSSGTYNNRNYTEALFGVSYFFKEWLAWRNALFYRFADQTLFGLDSSARGIFSYDLSRTLAFTAFGGPGYRFASQWPSAPFLEAGAVLHFSGLSVGLGFKSILNSMTDSKYSNDNQLLIIIGGSGTLF